MPCPSENCLCTFTSKCFCQARCFIAGTPNCLCGHPSYLHTDSQKEDLSSTIFDFDSSACVSVAVPEQDSPGCYDLYAQLCYSGCYLPNQRLREMVDQKVNNSLVRRVIHSMRQLWVHPDSFQKIEGVSETKVVDLILQLMLGRLAKLFDTDEISCVKQTTSNNYMCKGSNPKHTFCISFNNREIPVLATETKGFEAPSRNCLVQLVAAGGDSALNLVHLGWDVQDAVIPLIAFTGIGIQFGEVYLMESHFPVMTMLSDSLDICGSRESEEVIATWLVKIVLFCLETKNRGPTKETQKTKLVMSPSLSCNYFFKPVRTSFKELPQMEMTNGCSSRCNNLNRIMRMYKLVHDAEPSSERVLFPVGVVTIPAKENEPIRDFLLKKCNQFDLDEEASKLCPLIVFPLLSSKERWSTGKPDLHHREDYIDQVRQCLDHLNAARVAHIDARPANWMWRAKSETTVDLKLIDFEDAIEFGDIVASAFIKHVIKTNDTRYPFSRKDTQQEVIVTQKHNEFFFHAISNWVTSDIEEFRDYMNDGDNHSRIIEITDL